MLRMVGRAEVGERECKLMLYLRNRAPISLFSEGLQLGLLKSLSVCVCVCPSLLISLEVSRFFDIGKHPSAFPSVLLSLLLTRFGPNFLVQIDISPRTLHSGQSVAELG